MTPAIFSSEDDMQLLVRALETMAKPP